jgi:hypothetical protein
VDRDQAVFLGSVKNNEHSVLTSNEKSLRLLIILKCRGFHVLGAHHFHKRVVLTCDFEVNYADYVLTRRIYMPSGLVDYHVNNGFFMYFEQLV